MKNNLLIANPIISDPIFAGKVIFIFEHNDKGTHGVILNSEEIGKVGFAHMEQLFNSAPGDFDQVKDLILNGQLKSVPLYSGGPCSTPGIYFIHGHEEFKEPEVEPKSEFDLGLPDSFDVFGDSPYKENTPLSKMFIMDGLYFGSPLTFGNIVEAGKLKENKFRFFTGISSWGAGQLEQEISQGAWTIIDNAPVADFFFDHAQLELMVATVVKIRTPPNPSWIPKMPDGYNPSLN
jgi:putative AlgH/UPF0301 family transcriptional regulator